MKELLDRYVLEYETEDFIKNDPVQFVHRFKNKKDIEIAGFITSLFSYGKRELFIKFLDNFFKTTEERPLDFVLNGDRKLIESFGYRFSKGIDLIQILDILKILYSENETLETLFDYSYSEKKNINGMLQGVYDYFNARVTYDVTAGFKQMIPNPSKLGSMKRLNMMLRWFVRKSVVDVGIWKFIDKADLIIPLDVHVGNISREIGLLSRKNNDFKSALEITENLKIFDKKDPVKYDFALFGIGVNGNNKFLEELKKIKENELI